jgi:hypothetical protein
VAQLYPQALNEEITKCTVEMGSGPIHTYKVSLVQAFKINRVVHRRIDSMEIA